MSRRAVRIGLLYGVPFSILLFFLLPRREGDSDLVVALLTLGMGIAGGLGFGYAMSFFIKDVEGFIPTEHTRPTSNDLRLLMASIGYRPAGGSESELLFKPSLRAGPLSGRIKVVVTEGGIAVTGPQNHILRLQEMYRESLLHPDEEAR